jgi:hypothetical protein
VVLVSGPTVGLLTKCYLCGATYEVTEEATRQHTHHAQELGYAANGHGAEVRADGYRPSAGQLAVWLEACQRERDEALLVSIEAIREVGRLAQRRRLAR